MLAPWLPPPRGRAQARRIRDLVRGNAALQSLLVANALWELSLAALKTFVVLYVTAELGHSRSFAALVIGGVAVLVLGAALAAGKLGDRVRRLVVVPAAPPVYGLGLLVPFQEEGERTDDESAQPDENATASARE